jgi:hypothetical protein
MGHQSSVDKKKDTRQALDSNRIDEGNGNEEFRAKLH